jgi:outer membrane lipoprotein-sorting protein
MKASRTILFITLAMAGIAFAAEPATTQPAPEHNPTTRASTELLDQVQTQLRTVETVESDFVQEKQLSLLNHTLKINGHFALQKPNRVVWIVKEPVKYAVRVEGDEVRQWDQDTNKVQVINVGGDPTFKAITDQLQSWFLGDYKVLAESYDVFLESEKPLSLGFTPKANTMVAKVLKHVDITFGREGKYIDRMIVREASGDVTTLNFINTQINQPVKKQIWEIPPHDR